MRTKFRLVYFLLVFLAVFPVLCAQTWLVRHTPHFDFVYREASTSIVDRLESSAEKTYLEVTGLVGIVAPEPAVVLLADSMDDPPFGAYTTTFPRRIVIPLLPGLSPVDVLRHEYTHWLQSWVREPGFLTAASAVFGNDLLFSQIGLGPAMVEGTTSFIDGIRASPRNMAQIRAAMYDERMWTYEQGTVGSSYYPWGLRVYLSNWLTVDYLYRHYGLDALQSVIKNQSAEFPVFDRDSVRKVTGDDPAVLWGQALKDFRESWGQVATIPRGQVLTPKDAVDPESWSLPQKTARGWLVYKTSSAAVSELGFLDIDGRIQKLSEDGLTGENPGHRPSAAMFGAGTFGGPAGNSAPNPGGFTSLDPPVKNLISFSSDSSGNLIAFSTAPGLPSDGPDAVQNFELWLFRLDPGQKDSKLSGVPKKLGSSRLTAPAFSPDGTLLIASERTGSHQILVKVDQNTGAVEPLLDRPDIDVLESAISPDGSQAALLVFRAGQSDIGLFTFADGSFKLITDDPAEDSVPSWTNTRELSFSSDREDSLWSYLWNEDSNRFSRAFKEPVGSFGLRPLGGGYVYRSPETNGQSLFYLRPDQVHSENLESFAALRPGYLIAHDAALADMRAHSPAAADTVSISGNGSQHDAVFGDFPGPRYWMPSLTLNNGNIGFGAAVFGFDYLAHAQWSLQADYLPAWNQVVGDLGLLLSFDRAQARIGFGQSFEKSGDYWLQGSSPSLAASFRLLDLELPWGDTWNIDLNLGLSYALMSADPNPFDISEGFALQYRGERLTLAGGLGFALSQSASSMAYAGGPGLNGDAQLWLVPYGTGFGAGAGSPPLAFRSRAGFRLGLDDSARAGLFGLHAAFAYSTEAKAGSYLPPANSAWTKAGNYGRLETKIVFALNDYPTDPSLYAVAPVWSSLSLSVGAAAGFTDAALSQFSIDHAIYYQLSYKLGLRAYTNDLPYEISIAYRQNLDGVFAPGDDLYFIFGLNGLSLTP